jgi:hypothetical protein
MSVKGNWLPVVGYEGLYSVSDLGIGQTTISRIKHGKRWKRTLEKHNA